MQSSAVKVEADSGEEKLKKCEDDLKKEDKAELSIQSSFGSESVPDSPASQISQRSVPLLRNIFPVKFVTGIGYE